MIKISVIVPTFNRSSSLLSTLRSLAVQTLPVYEYEVIVVDDGSKDDTAQCVACFSAEHPLFNLRYEYHVINRMKAAASNTGILMAQGELIALLDDDIRPVPGWLEAHVQRHKSEKRDVSVTGLVLYPEEWERTSNWVRYANENYRKNETIRSIDSVGLPPNRFAGGNTSVRRDTLIRVGLFDEASLRLEDVSMGCQLFQAGVPLLFESNAIVYHYSDVILSMDATLRSFRRSFEFDLPKMNKKYPWYYEKYGHWFLAPPNKKYDTPLRYCAKLFVRLVAHRPIQRVTLHILKLVDDLPWLYWRPLYQYVQVCEAIYGIRASQRTMCS
jgi:glycosyltransferase involved in cell wall biosynthesis